MHTFSIEHPSCSATIRGARFHGRNGADEYHLMITNSTKHGMEAELAVIEEAYRFALESLNLKDETAVFRRIFASDLANQADTLKQSGLWDPGIDQNPVAVSLVEQPPLPDRRYALFAYHVDDIEAADKKRLGRSVALDRNGLTHLFTTGVLASAADETRDAFDQTEQIFDSYEKTLGHLGATLTDNVLRTWFFVQNVDNNYAGMVKARKAIFAERGLTKETHYIASTGIEGRHIDHRCNVLLDAYAVAGIDTSQIRYLSAPDHLGPTIDYGVTFERGTCVDYRDRRHILISGTASIDPAGNTLHKGDIVSQTKRTIENAASLLSNAGATLSDLAHLIVYMRDHADFEPVRREIERRFPNTPTVFLKAPVCRPDWLVEVECMAVVSADNPALNPF